MTTWIPQANDPVVAELTALDERVIQLAASRDGTMPMLEYLGNKYPKDTINDKGIISGRHVEFARPWELAGKLYLDQGRTHEALEIFRSLYRHKLDGQLLRGERAHKGKPLVWMSDAFRALNFPVHGKRYLM